ncbi:MAG: aminopeptidase P family protein [Firmicutes bacterium]|nr:aminopeptidase P family protein [Bacillota bacterium]
MASFKPAEFQERIHRLQGKMQAKDVELVIISRNSDLFYYTGSVQPLYFILPVNGRGIVLARKAIERIEAEASHLKLEVFNNSKDLMAILNRYRFDAVKRVGFTLDNISYASVQRWQQLIPGAEIVNLSWEIRSLRLVKSEAEIGIQVKAGEIMAQLPEVVKSGFRPGMTELELSAVIEKYMREKGHTGLVRCYREGIEMGLGVCSAGANSLVGTKFDGVCAGVGTSAAVSYGAGWEPIPKGAPVTLDYAFNLEGYHIDQTRMFCWGEPSKVITEAYQRMAQIEATIFDHLKPGVNWEKAYGLAVHLAEEYGYTKEFMGLGSDKVRFVGHGIGLELDEPPFIASGMEEPLAENMVVAIEPKVALAGVGVVGVEDTVVIKQSGIELITTCPREIILIQ